MPKDTQEMYTEIYEQECVEWNNTSKSKRVWTSICSILFAVSVAFWLVVELFDLL